MLVLQVVLASMCMDVDCTRAAWCGVGSCSSSFHNGVE